MIRRSLVRDNLLQRLHYMVQRRAKVAVAKTRISCHTFLATGITIYFPNGGVLDKAQMMVAHESLRTSNVRDVEANGVSVSHRDFFQAIRDFADRLQPDTVGLFYYSGHGMQVNNRTYMIPTDADISREVDVEVNALPIENVIAQMESRKVDSSSKPNFVILDACLFCAEHRG